MYETNQIWLRSSHGDYCSSIVIMIGQKLHIFIMLVVNENYCSMAINWQNANFLNFCSFLCNNVSCRGKFIDFFVLQKLLDDKVLEYKMLKEQEKELMENKQEMKQCKQIIFGVWRAVVRTRSGLNFQLLLEIDAINIKIAIFKENKQ